MAEPNKLEKIGLLLRTLSNRPETRQAALEQAIGIRQAQAEAQKEQEIARIESARIGRDIILEGLENGTIPQEMAAQKLTEFNNLFTEFGLEGEVIPIPQAPPEEVGVRVIGSDNPLNEQLKLGIPKDNFARVLITKDSDGNLKGDVKGRFGPGQTIEVNTGLSDSDASKLRKELIDRKTGVRQIEGLIGDAKAILKENPDAATLGGTLSAFAKNAAANIGSIARALSIDTSDVHLDPDEFEGDFGDLAGASRELKSLAIALAYSLAVSKGQTNRALSDKDLEQQFEEVSLTKNSDPKIIIRVLDSVLARTKRNFNLRHQTASEIVDLGGIQPFDLTTKEKEKTKRRRRFKVVNGEVVEVE